jgi:hypothetical protein
MGHDGIEQVRGACIHVVRSRLIPAGTCMIRETTGETTAIWLRFRAKLLTIEAQCPLNTEEKRESLVIDR